MREHWAVIRTWFINMITIFILRHRYCNRKLCCNDHPVGPHVVLRSRRAHQHTKKNSSKLQQSDRYVPDVVQEPRCGVMPPTAFLQYNGLSTAFVQYNYSASPFVHTPRYEAKALVRTKRTLGRCLYWENTNLQTLCYAMFKMDFRLHF